MYIVHYIERCRTCLWFLISFLLLERILEAIIWSLLHYTCLYLPFILSTYLVLGIFDNIWARNVEQHPPEVEIIMHFPELSVESDLLCTCLNVWVSISLLNAHKGIKIKWVVDLNCAMETDDCLKKVKKLNYCLQIVLFEQKYIRTSLKWISNQISTSLIRF